MTKDDLAKKLWELETRIEVLEAQIIILLKAGGWGTPDD